MNKNDIWRELEERLKQKAKSDAEIKRCMHLTEEQMQTIHKLPPKEIQNYLDKLSQETKWVRLEDVQKLIEEIKEKYAVISKEKAKKLCDLWVSHIEPLDHQAENPYYFHLVLTEEEKNEFSQILKELLRKNEG